MAIAYFLVFFSCCYFGCSFISGYAGFVCSNPVPSIFKITMTLWVSTFKNVEANVQKKNYKNKIGLLLGQPKCMGMSTMEDHTKTKRQYNPRLHRMLKIFKITCTQSPLPFSNVWQLLTLPCVLLIFCFIETKSL